MRQNVHIEGLDEAVKKIKGDLWEKPVKDFFERAGIAVLGEATRRSPIDTGRLASSLSKGTTDNIWKPISDGLEIGTAVRAGGFSYPRALDESSRYHYKGGKAQGRAHAGATAARHKARAALLGQQTKGWFSEAPDRAKDMLDKCVQKLKDEIAKRWPN